MRFIAIDLAACKKAGLSVEEWCILALLHRECSCKRTDVSQALGIHRASLFRKLKRLEERGFVYKEGDVYRVSDKFERYLCQEGEQIETPIYKKQQRRDNFERIIDELKERIEISDKLIPILKDFYDYRRSIKKPINTYRPLLAYIKALKQIREAGYDVQQAIDLMKEREWQTLTLDYVKNSLPKSESQPQYVWW